ncbi:hypothetical protein POM88_008807 [Heracleum sosnowskyi]|uniref:Uncharacterized protein n=1 Tax=Heracleum sosnowskyi TaxID=360622 RepID=A0AAD8N7Q4_9APIA|nr:hypothetical protein POM88_008804 [Heracleum sosnowskyi]KAK1398944.1 hypothetical protein POM88_008807 [Heracleum sosnowskyi]
MDWKNLHGYIEVSPFMLFESTGDSEEVSELNNSSFHVDNVKLTYNEADDAQSCCSDSSDIFNAFENDQFQESSYSKKSDRKRVHGHDYNDSNYRYQNDCDEDEDDDDGAISQECSSRNLGFGYSRTQKKCKVYVDSELEPLKKLEEHDKLFWDTCLAS